MGLQVTLGRVQWGLIFLRTFLAGVTFVCPNTQPGLRAQTIVAGHD